MLRLFFVNLVLFFFSCVLKGHYLLFHGLLRNYDKLIYIPSAVGILFISILSLFSLFVYWFILSCVLERLYFSIILKT